MPKLTLKACRINAGLDQKTASEILGVSQVTLSNWENSKTTPNMAQVSKICEVYGVGVENLNFLPKD